MRVFVAGATGVIGRSLVPLLVQEGHEVTGLTRREERADLIRELGAEPAIADAFDPDGLRDAVVAARPEVVVHELTDIPRSVDPKSFAEQFERNNRLRREGTRNLLAAARAAGATRFLAESVAFAYQPVGDWVKDENAPLALGSPPPMDEIIGALASLESQVLEAGGTVLRYGFIYGPGTQLASDGMYAGFVRKRLFPIVGSGDGRWSFIHADDAAGATVAALARGNPGVYNVVDDEPARVADWLPVYAAALGAGRPLHIPAWMGRLVGGSVAVMGMTEQRGASNAKAKVELGWQPKYASWRDGFRAAGG
jgi:nucleoside-diphosphate-sugar epimerase